jgi:hypothetical protein
MFLLVSLSFITALTITSGHVAYGDAGALTYARYINGVPYPHWQGEPPGNGTPVHPSRQILESPPVYEFGTPIGGTYPISYNPAYWYEGLTIRFDLQRQLDYLSYSALFYIDIFFRQLSALTFGVLILYLMSRWKLTSLSDVIARWDISIVALFGFATYALVNVLGRYVAVFVVLFWAGMLLNIQLPASRHSEKLTSAISIVMVLLLLVNIASFNLERVRDLLGWGDPHQFTQSNVARPSWPGEVAESLHGLGIEPGDRVGVIGFGFSSFWARLADVQIVAELLSRDAEAFYLGDAQVQNEVIHAFAGTGASAIVAEKVPTYAKLSGWHQVGRSNYYIYLLEP